MTVLARDNFNRANETPLASPWGSTGILGDVGMNLVSNAATDAATTYDNRSFYDGGIVWPNDQYSQAAITLGVSNSGGGSGEGLSVRGSKTALTMYRFAIDHNATINWEVLKAVGGTFTSLATGLQAFTDGDTFRLSVNGSTITVSLNGASPFVTVVDSAIASGNPGINYSSTEGGVRFVDDWEGGDLVGPPGLVVRQAVKRAAYF